MLQIQAALESARRAGQASTGRADRCCAQICKSHPEQSRMQPKEKLHVRIRSLPFHLDVACPESNPGVGGLKCSHLGQLITLSGTVVRTGSVKMLEAKRLYECPKCHHRQAGPGGQGALPCRPTLYRPGALPQGGHSGRECDGGGGGYTSVGTCI